MLIFGWGLLSPCFLYSGDHSLIFQCQTLFSGPQIRKTSDFCHLSCTWLGNALSYKSDKLTELTWCSVFHSQNSASLISVCFFTRPSGISPCLEVPPGVLIEFIVRLWVSSLIFPGNFSILNCVLCHHKKVRLIFPLPLALAVRAG